MIDTSAQLLIGGVIGSLAKYLIASGMRGGYASWGAALLSLFVSVLYIFTHGGFHIATLWDNFVGYVAVLVSAGGAFHVIENAPAVVQSIKGANS